MRMEFYIKTIPYDKNDMIYGVVSYIDNKPFDYMLGMYCGNKKEVNENITGRLLKKHKSNLSYNSYVFKYDDLQITKEMNYKFKNDEFYQEYSRKNNTELFASPSVFLSDLEKTKDLSSKINNYKLMRDYVKSYKGR